MEGIKLLDDNSIDLVVIDPPYKLDLNKVRKTNTFNNYANELLELKEAYILNYPEIAKDKKKVIKKRQPRTKKQ